MTFLELITSLEKSKIRYLVVGGIAVNLHGIERPTKDIDLIVYLERSNLLRFTKLVTRLGFCPRVPVKPEDFADPKNRSEWARTKNMVVFSFYHSEDLTNVVDVFIKHPLPFLTSYKKRTLVDVGRIKIPIMCIPDLIKLKEKAGRLQDKSDIRALKEILKIQQEIKDEKSSKKKRI